MSSEIVGLAGGPNGILQRARALLDAGQLDLALTLVQFAVDAAAPGSSDAARAHTLRAEVLRAKERAEPSYMAQGIYRSFRLLSEESSKL